LAQIDVKRGFCPAGESEISVVHGFAGNVFD
jgi:hypothetical protein